MPWSHFYMVLHTTLPWSLSSAITFGHIMLTSWDKTAACLIVPLANPKPLSSAFLTAQVYNIYGLLWAYEFLGYFCEEYCIIPEGIHNLTLQRFLIQSQVRDEKWSI